VHERQAQPEQVYESGLVHERQAQPEQVYESGQVHHRRAQPEWAHEWDQIYNQLADTEPLSHLDPNEDSAGGLQGDVAPRPHVDGQGGNGIDSFADPDYPEDERESAPDGELLIEDRGISDEQDEGRKANGEANRRRGSSVLQ
jgi:hypothetical protein